ncbi:MAG: histidine phosphatase family protein [Bacteroidales bacterium]|nr:histidine phosphatase family protein [Bacteroidales bacterium]
MNNILFIRHGEPDYIHYLKSSNNACISIPRDSVGLSDNGIRCCEKMCDTILKFNPSVIISSPYTRALQSAHIISSHTSIPLLVEKNFVEWLSELSISINGHAEYQKLLDEVTSHNGEYSNNCKYKWESIHELKKRALSSIITYSNKYERIAVVTHKMLIYQLTGLSLPFCGIVQTCVEDISSNNQIKHSFLYSYDK